MASERSEPTITIVVRGAVFTPADVDAIIDALRAECAADEVIIIGRRPEPRDG